jgi:hypothetical protein
MNSLEDETAIRILKTIAQARLNAPGGELAGISDVVPALSEAFGYAPARTSSEGDLARAALALLSENPTFAEPIRLMALQSGGPSQTKRYFEPSTIALTTAVLFALQTRIRFKVDQSGKWSVDVDKKAASDSVLKIVVERLLSFLRK